MASVASRRPISRLDQLGVDIPLSPDQMTAEFLTAVLRSDGSLSEANVVSCSATAIGTGQMSSSVRYTLEYDRHEHGAPGAVVSKYASASADVRAFMSKFGYVRELAFYHDLASDCRARIPGCHVAYLAPDREFFLLLFEDLAPSRPGDQILGMSADEARLAVTELVHLHASFWHDDRIRAVGFARPMGGPSEAGPTLASAIPGFLDRVGGALTDAEIGFYESLLHGGATHWLERRPKPTTLSHNDYRLDNLMFASPDGAGEQRVAVLDWQGCAAGTGTDDLAFLLGTSMEPRDRAAAECDLVAMYCDGLRSSGVSGISLESCWQDYRCAVITGLFTTIFGAAYGEPTERGNQMFQAMARRSAQQALALGYEEFIAS